MSLRIRTPRSILEELATRQGLVTPVPDHMALGPRFCEACLVEGYSDLLDRLKEIASAGPESAEAIQLLMRELQDAVAAKRP